MSSASTDDGGASSSLDDDSAPLVKLIGESGSGFFDFIYNPKPMDFETAMRAILLPLLFYFTYYLLCWFSHKTMRQYLNETRTGVIAAAAATASTALNSDSKVIPERCKTLSPSGVITHGGSRRGPRAPLGKGGGGSEYPPGLGIGDGITGSTTAPHAAVKIYEGESVCEMGLVVKLDEAISHWEQGLSAWGAYEKKNAPRPLRYVIDGSVPFVMISYNSALKSSDPEAIGGMLKILKEAGWEYLWWDWMVINDTKASYKQADFESAMVWAQTCAYEVVVLVPTAKDGCEYLSRPWCMSEILACTSRGAHTIYTYGDAGWYSYSDALVTGYVKWLHALFVALDPIITPATLFYVMWVVVAQRYASDSTPENEPTLRMIIEGAIYDIIFLTLRLFIGNWVGSGRIGNTEFIFPRDVFNYMAVHNDAAATAASEFSSSNSEAVAVAGGSSSSGSSWFASLGTAKNENNSSKHKHKPSSKKLGRKELVAALCDAGHLKGVMYDLGDTMSCGTLLGYDSWRFAFEQATIKWANLVKSVDGGFWPLWGVLSYPGFKPAPKPAAAAAVGSVKAELTKPVPLITHIWDESSFSRKVSFPNGRSATWLKSRCCDCGCACQHCCSELSHSHSHSHSHKYSAAAADTNTATAVTAAPITAATITDAPCTCAARHCACQGLRATREDRHYAVSGSFTGKEILWVTSPGAFKANMLLRMFYPTIPLQIPLGPVELCSPLLVGTATIKAYYLFLALVNSIVCFELSRPQGMEFYYGSGVTTLIIVVMTLPHFLMTFGYLTLVCSGKTYMFCSLASGGQILTCFVVFLAHFSESGFDMVWFYYGLYNLVAFALFYLHFMFEQLCSNDVNYSRTLSMRQVC